MNPETPDPLRVIGTLMVERSDGLGPDDEETKELERFARQFAVLIDQSERVLLLQSALDKQRHPLVILDWQLRLRYANEKAARYTDPRLATGWLPEGCAIDLDEWQARQGKSNLAQQV